MNLENELEENHMYGCKSSYLKLLQVNNEIVREKLNEEGYVHLTKQENQVVYEFKTPRTLWQFSDLSDIAA